MASPKNPIQAPLIGPPPRDAAQQAEWDRIGQERLAQDQERLRQYLEAMQADTARHKRNWEVQKLLLAAAIIYAGQDDSWRKCDCQFCLHFRRFKDDNDAQVIQGQFWDDPVYMANRQPIDQDSLTKCRCSFCQNVTRVEAVTKQENVAHSTKTVKEPIYYPDSMALDARATEPGFSPPPRTPPPGLQPIWRSFPGAYNYDNASSSTPYGYSNNNGASSYGTGYGMRSYAGSTEYNYTGAYTPENDYARASVGNYHGVYGNAPTASNTTSYPAVDSGYAQDSSTESSSHLYYGTHSASRNEQTSHGNANDLRLPPGLPFPSNRQRNRNRRAFDRHQGSRGGHGQANQAGHGQGGAGQGGTGQSSHSQGSYVQSNRSQGSYGQSTPSQGSYGQSHPR
ncbi:hypothetical protein ABW21_db0202204 [Orbilia brochopaga]|nr:hypothetical protein ABW21_db0202204 [Drechslerella brochopaga]